MDHTNHTRLTADELTPANIEGATVFAVGDVDFMRDEDEEVPTLTSWTKDRLKEMPEHRD